MASWTERRRAGGGQLQVGQQVSMNEAEQSDVDVIDVSYTGVVTAADFTPANFSTIPGSITGTAVAQNSSTGLSVTFASDVSGSTAVAWAGANPRMRNPDQKQLN